MEWDFLVHLFMHLFICCVLAAWHVGSLFPDQGSNTCPLYRKCRASTTGLPGKSLPSLSLFFLDNLGKVLSVYLWISILEVMVVYAPPLHYCGILDSSTYLPISASFILLCYVLLFSALLFQLSLKFSTF